VGAFLGDEQSANTVIQEWQERYQKYKLMEAHLNRRREEIKKKIPDITGTRELVEHIIKKRDESEDVETNFQLSDTVYANAVIKEPTNVCLWLGANVMVEYPIDDAFELLTENRDNAHVNLKSVDEDIQFLRDQITTTEVNIARIFNYDVMQRRKKKESGGETSGGAEGGD
jgi:prefoldin subunit 5